MHPSHVSYTFTCIFIFYIAFYKSNLDPDATFRLRHEAYSSMKDRLHDEEVYIEELLEIHERTETAVQQFVLSCLSKKHIYSFILARTPLLFCVA